MGPNTSAVFSRGSSFYDGKAKRENEQQRELDEMKEEVFNLPDNLVRGECDTVDTARALPSSSRRARGRSEG